MNVILLSIVFGSVGMGYFIYGKKQANPVVLAIGVALMVVPYVISNWMVLGALGLILCALPFVL